MRKKASPRKTSQALVHVETTMDSESAVHRLVGLALAQRLAACAQVATLRSKYWWEGRIEEAAEFLVVFKTTPARRKELLALVEAEHPYEVPYIATSTMQDVPASYASWLAQETLTRGR